MLIGSDDYHTATTAVDVAQVEDVVASLGMEHLFIVTQTIFALGGPQVIGQVVH